VNISLGEVVKALPCPAVTSGGGEMGLESQGLWGVSGNLKGRTGGLRTGYGEVKSGGP